MLFTKDPSWATKIFPETLAIAIPARDFHDDIALQFRIQLRDFLNPLSNFMTSARTLLSDGYDPHDFLPLIGIRQLGYQRYYDKPGKRPGDDIDYDLKIASTWLKYLIEYIFVHQESIKKLVSQYYF